MKVSVIVPVYNTEKYLKNCIDSLLKQNFENYEIIVINDLSPGNAEEIIKSYNDKKIVYIKNKTNKGIGYNRNLGIKKAKGEYVCFIDSDDYVKEDFISKMYNYSKENNLDLCVCDYVNVDEEGNKLKEFNLSDFCITNYEENNKILCEINLAPWNKLYKKDMLVKNKIEFSETLKYEDLSFVALSIKNSKKIGKINEQLNYYTIHNNSETTTRDKRVFDIFKQLDIVRNEYKSGKYLDELTVSVLLNYTIQQRYQIDKDTQSKFIDDAFKYLNDNNIDYKHSEYIKNRSFLKRLIEKNKFITKIYCKIYRMLKTR
ncbi:MAG: glycosyltransferase family 2 protein [Bacilli bacterium]|nr:glycosyltransferase family 2 protein [Bacilli bacterium]